MSCGEGKPCREALHRRTALGVLFLMLLIFLGLSAVSFIDSRGQVTPDNIRFGTHEAVPASACSRLTTAWVATPWSATARIWDRI